MNHFYAMQMCINTAEIFVQTLLLITQEHQGDFRPKFWENVQFVSSINLLITCSKSGMSTKEISTAYFDKIKETIIKQLWYGIVSEANGSMNCKISIRWCLFSHRV